MLEIQKFLHEYKNDWKKILESSPYNLIIREMDDLVLFMYNQIESDFNIPLVQECRGIILNSNDFSVVCMGFTKFWNHGEVRAAKIDWSTAKALEKIDGSIQKLFWYNNEWCVSTMSMISAKECTLQNNINPEYQTFYDLFIEGAKKCTLNFNNLNKNYTYIFELVSPYNRVVVPYKEIKIYHIGTRDNITLKELDIDIGVDKPKQYSFTSKEDLLTIVQNMPFTEEGYVIVDVNWNRVKIKSPAYVAVHKLHNNGEINKKRALELIVKNDHKEFLSYYPEYTEYFNKIEYVWNEYVIKVQLDVNNITSREFTSRKEYALYARTLTNPTLMFLLLDKKITKDTWKEWLYTQPSEKMVEILKI